MTTLGFALLPKRVLNSVLTSSSRYFSVPRKNLHETDGQKFTWLWPTYPEMQHYIAGHNVGSKQTGMTCRCNTTKPLDQEHVRQALRHLQRQLPVFRTLLRERNDELWLCRSHDDMMDFEVLADADTEQVMTEMLTVPFKADAAPLWKARLIPVPDDAPCQVSGIKETFPYQCDLIFVPHHAIADGNTMVTTTRCLIELLNDAISGNPIDDNKPSGVLLDASEVSNIDAAVMKTLEKDPERLASLKKEVLACDSPPSILKVFPPPGGKPATRCIMRHVDTGTLARFRAACKANGVSFNSGFEAVINTVYVKLLKDGGLEDESFDISINLATNLRRYMEPRSLPILGLFARPTVHRIRTPITVREHFWEYAKRLHHTLSHLLHSKAAFEQDVVRRMTQPTIPAEDYFAGQPQPLRDYGLTNLGDFTNMISGKEEHLQLTGLKMFAAIHLSVYMMLHQIYTFRGISPYTLSYDSSYMTEDTANLLIDAVLQLIEDLPESRL